jgi:DNA-binding CsgD family transcriptional regulator/PAS domain-containing protein
MGVWIAANGQIAEISLAEIWRPMGAVYKERFSTIDPWAGSLARAPLETIMLGYEHLRENELIKTAFYNEFARAGGMFRPMGVKMQLSPSVFATIGSDMPWSKLRFHQSDKPRLQRVVPYVKRALQLRRRWQSAQAHAMPSAAAFDALAFGALICDASGRVVVVNKAAEAIFRAGAGIELRNKALAAAVLAEGRVLAALINDAATGGPGGVILLTGRSGYTELFALVTPLPPRLSVPVGTSSPLALVTLRSARDSPSFTSDMLARLFALSPAQAAIALAIFNGKSPEQIAVERGVAITTLRTHLAEIFARTGAENQRDLIRLLGMLPPVRAQPGS